MKDLQKLYIYCSPNSDFLDEVGKVAEEETKKMAQLFKEMCPAFIKEDNDFVFACLEMIGKDLVVNTIKELIKRKKIHEVK